MRVEMKCKNLAPTNEWYPEALERVNTWTLLDVYDYLDSHHVDTTEDHATDRIRAARHMAGLNLAQIRKLPTRKECA